MSNEPESKVFLLNFSGHNLRNLPEFGRIIFLTEGNVNIFSVDRLKYILQAELDKHKYDSGRDFIAMSGNLMLGYAMGEILHRYNNKKLLIYDNKKQIYLMKEVGAWPTMQQVPGSVY